jgi:hypothetical protein
MAVMAFLQEEAMLGCERIQMAKRHFNKAPWKFHHSERVARSTSRINPYPYNSQDYYYTSGDLPLWAVRQVHYGKEHIRVVLFTSEVHWGDMVQFYRLIFGLDPELLRDDFCLFTIHTHIHYDVQFALKKLKGDTKPRPLDSVKLQLRVADLGHLISYFPHVCTPLSDTKWETRDHDGNTIVFDVASHVIHHPNKAHAHLPTPTRSKSVNGGGFYV